jgi:hypothetical protein
MRAFLVAVSLSLALGSVGCAHRRASAPETQSITPPSPSYVSPPTFAFRDFSLQIGADVLGLTSRGEMTINGTFVGTLWPDGSFHGRSGVEIARLYPNGTMMFDNTLQDTRLEGATMLGPNGPIAFIDQSGGLYFTEAQASVPVIGITSDSIWTVLFSMGLFGVRDSWMGM